MDTHDAIFYTVQAKPAWETALRKENLGGSSTYVSPDFKEAYQWMRQQMSLRLPQYNGGDPIWLWPDCPTWKDGSYGHPQDLVLIEAKIPLHRVLLSDFQSWHAVLNKFPVLAHPQERIDMKASWERIFDFEFLEAAPEWGEVEIQGVVESITLHEIVSVENFSGEQIF